MKTLAKTTKAEPERTVSAIKGFNKDFQCLGYQFEVGKTYEQGGDIVVCHNGFHAVSGSPFDAWNHYPIIASDGSLNRYGDVTLSGAISEKKGERDSKFAGAKITVNAEIRLPELINRAVSWIIDATNEGSSGNSARIGSSGNFARIGSSGDSAKIGSSGYFAQIGSSGNSAQIGSSGNSAKIGSSGDSAQIGSSGDSAQIGSSGNSARIGSSGDSAKIVIEGKNSVVACAGPGSVVSGIDGTWIAIPEFVDEKCIGFATGCIGQDGLLPNTTYTAKGGKLVATGAA